MTLLKSLRNAALAAVLFSAGVAHAGLLQFNLTGDYTASWQMNSTVSPDIAAQGVGFILWDVAGNFPGASEGVADLTFFNADIDGGMEILDFYGDTLLLSTDGFQLYSGSEDNPIFLLGTFSLTEYLGTGTYSLSVSEVGAANVPEPATGALLLGGLALMVASRKRWKA